MEPEVEPKVDRLIHHDHNTLTPLSDPCDQTDSDQTDSDQTDADGFLQTPLTWTPLFAAMRARENQITLTPEHLALIELAREFYLEHTLHLTNRALVKLVREHYGTEKGNSIYVQTLFPGSPARLVALLGGLPKPPFCF
ncbi:MAG: TusE/DsrC/DsvC family sulfur relay protein [Gammaproteobacteria bacterium]